MNPPEELYQAKAEHDRQIDAVLLDLDCDEAAFQIHCIDSFNAAGVYAKALIAAVPHVGAELGEGYIETAGKIVVETLRFMEFIGEPRRRQRSAS